MCEGDNEIGQETSEYFQSFSSTSNLFGGDDIFAGIQKRITDSMNVMLTKTMKDVEIKTALFSMNPRKTPGPDSMTPFFFQQFCAAVRVFFESEQMLIAFNHTFIALIPKVKHVMKVFDF